MKKLSIVVILILFSTTILGCSSCRNIKNAPRLIDLYAEGVTDLSFVFPSGKIIQLSSESEEAVIGQSPTIVIVCENIEKDSFLDVEVYDSYYPNNILLYSGDSDEYSASATTSMDIPTQIWTTTIKIKLPTFESFDDRTIVIRKIDFLREAMKENVEAILEDAVDTLTFEVDPNIPSNLYLEKLYYQFMLRYVMNDTSSQMVKDDFDIPEDMDRALMLMILPFDDVIAYGETKIVDLPRFGQVYFLVPPDLSGRPIDWLRLYINNSRIHFVLTTLDYTVLEIGGTSDCSAYTLYCTFDSQTLFGGKTAEDIFEVINDSGYQIVYNYVID